MDKTTNVAFIIMTCNNQCMNVAHATKIAGTAPPAMRAAWYTTNGAARDVLQVGCQPKPIPAPGELLIQIAYSSVNPGDAKHRAGALGNPPSTAVIPHSDGSGVVQGVGEGLDAAAWAGQKVWIYHAQRGRASGTAAEYICLPARLCRIVQGSYSLRDVSAIGIPMITAHACVFAGGIPAGKRVLVTGAAGGVGRYAVQWARWAGATSVIGTVLGPAQKSVALHLGASDVLDVSTEPVEAWVEKLYGKERSIDLVIDLDMARNAPWAQQVLAPHGTWAIFASGAPIHLSLRDLLNTNARLRFVQSNSLSTPELESALEDIDRIHAQGFVQHTIAEELPLEQIVAAHERVEQGHRQGATLLRVGGGA